MPRSQEEIRKDINYDESKVPVFKLPSPLERPDGGRVTTAYEWVNRRRGEVLDFYKKEVYGQLPPRPDRIRFETLSVRDNALGNTAIRKEIRIHFEMNSARSHSFVMLLYIPKNAKLPPPVFLGLNFKGNHAATDEPDVMMTGRNIAGELLEPDGRGNQVHRWQFRETIQCGYASATACYHDIYPDFCSEEGWHRSVYGLFYPEEPAESIHKHASSISAWAWGLSRMLDGLENEPSVDASKAVVHGHSRLGKTALWAGATDPRFRLVISNDSGCGGAALFKRCFGENLEAILALAPYWFVSDLQRYINNEAALPFDQHWLISLIAPTSHERIRMIAEKASGFVYCVSSLGVTGTRSSITTDTGAMVRLVKEAADIPCAVGFGISTPEQAEEIARSSDGVIVGSAIVELCGQYGRDCVPHVAEYVRKMCSCLYCAHE